MRCPHIMKNWNKTNKSDFLLKEYAKVRKKEAWGILKISVNKRANTAVKNKKYNYRRHLIYFWNQIITLKQKNQIYATAI